MKFVMKGKNKNVVSVKMRNIFRYKGTIDDL